VTVGRAAGSSTTAGAWDEAAVSDDTVTKDCRLALSTSMLAAGSTMSWKCNKKSTPTMGKDTAASRKFQVKRRPGNIRVRVFSPQHGMG
jgi:hypothetical protein